MDNIPKSKFRGVMIGALVGDCLGSEFEFSVYNPKHIDTVQKHFDELEEGVFNGIKKYTDDTAMMKNVARTLIVQHPLDYTLLAKLFTEEYFQDPHRCYGGHIITVFRSLKVTDYGNVFEPAAKQFNGQGSYGNGGAMRIAPVALYHNTNYKEMIDVAKKVTQLTHTHSLGINGALLQCIAVHECLNWTGEFNAERYINTLIKKLKDIDKHAGAFVRKLELIKDYLNRNLNPSTFVKDEEIIKSLGTDEIALDSVATAIYCFVQAHQGFPGIHTDNVFRRAIQYAILLGGDADTIAAMTGAITGAYFGESGINQRLVKHCEFGAEMLQLADELYDASILYCTKISSKDCDLM